jgi:hypothetical protein
LEIFYCEVWGQHYYPCWWMISGFFGQFTVWAFILTFWMLDDTVVMITTKVKKNWTIESREREKEFAWVFVYSFVTCLCRII